jgi:hypothetical protein
MLFSSFFPTTSSSLSTNVFPLIYSTVYVDALVSTKVSLSFFFSASNSFLWVSHWIFILFLNSTLIWSLCACIDMFIFFVLRLFFAFVTFLESMVNLSFTFLYSISNSMNLFLVVLRALVTSRIDEAFIPAKSWSVEVVGYLKDR